MTFTDRIAQRPLVERLRLKLAVAEIATAAAQEAGVALAAILGQTRRQSVARARQRVMFEARQRGLSYPEIGYALGRDHSTIIHGVRAEAKRRGVSA